MNMYMPDKIVERIIIWKEIKDAEIIARQAHADVLTTNCQFDIINSILKQRNQEYEQICSVASLYARNDAINDLNAAKKKCKIAQIVHSEANIALQIAQTNI